ncbi:transporter, NhaC family [Virgibacillus subterraneus]|uniref:Transporter, NhaC family n=1 Tax=Virgibacillus subterraneus TaxID=621109 RepID=A0A1H9ASB0_9BACI|nr:Na+/H+ antiporter NhaC family protein [Virgibacillus subterraneus]SEP78798.1 transporter, NhaC family [Virgibacillus subterraneus]
MDTGATLGFVSILPPLIAIVLAFWTKNTILSLGAACFLGVLLAGNGLMGFPDLMKRSLGNESFSWIFLLEIFIGILIAFFQRTGAIQSFGSIIERKKPSRNNIGITTWFMGMFVFFSDYFTPIFVGSTMRKVTDKVRISRDKLAYICDSTSAPVSVIIPITGWAVFISGLLIGMGPIADETTALAIFTKSIPFNIYAILSVLLVGLIVSGLVKDFGPMKAAEDRALNEGKVLSDKADPLISQELTNMEPYYKERFLSFGWNFVFPVLIIIGIAVGTYIFMGSAKTMEAFLGAAVVLGILMRVQGIPVKDIMDTAMNGIKGIMPAIMILVFAYTINTLSEDMGAANYLINSTESWLSPSLLPAITFILAALISFSTGTSWGTFGILIPILIPLSIGFSGGDINSIVLATIAAVAGGGVFGDHCSPLSDTTILASTGAGADHMDHVRTQLPYALTVGSIAVVAYLIIGVSV